MPSRRWKRLQRKFLRDREVDRLILVPYLGGSDARLIMLEKVYKENGKAVWKTLLNVKAYVGKYGIGKIKEGDMKTPVGTFHPEEAFGILEDPGCKGLPYTHLKEYHYWSEESETYNKMVDVRTLGRETIAGEHMTSFVPHYHYGMDIGYNKDCIYLKGSAIFMHCFGTNPYTGGCVAVSEEDMKKVLLHATKRMRVAIYPL